MLQLFDLWCALLDFCHWLLSFNVLIHMFLKRHMLKLWIFSLEFLWRLCSWHLLVSKRKLLSYDPEGSKVFLFLEFAFISNTESYKESTKTPCADKICRIVYPIFFIIFNIVYWMIYCPGSEIIWSIIWSKLLSLLF